MQPALSRVPPTVVDAIAFGVRGVSSYDLAGCVCLCEDWTDSRDDLWVVC